MSGETLSSQNLSPTILRPTKGWSGINLRELWGYRELFYFLVWRDIKVRYKQSLLGAGWAILQPVLTMVVFTLFFGQWAGLPTDGQPQPIFYFAGILPWQLFQSGAAKAGASLVASRSLITKVYFPRITVPLAPVIASLLDFAIAFIVLVLMWFYYGVMPTNALWSLPIFIALAVVTAIGAGLWLSALNVAYRDIGYVIPFLMQVWFFISPIVYSATVVPGDLQLIYALNPMAGVIQGFRWAILGDAGPTLESLLISTAISLLIAVSGVIYFRRMERTFADLA